MLMTVNVRARIPWSLGQVSLVGVLIALSLLLVSCAPVSYGPHYRPIYPEGSIYGWKGQPPSTLTIGSGGGCYIDLHAGSDEEKFWLTWTQREHTLWGKRCRLHVHEGPLVLEDLDTGNLVEIRIFTRKFRDGPALDVNKMVDLPTLLPGFAAVPKSEKRYVLSIELERKFDSSLPKEARIQLPDIQLGDRCIQLPPLILKQYEKGGKGWWYAPVSERKTLQIKRSRAGIRGYYLFKPADIWYEEETVVRVSSGFRGWSINKDESKITGEIYFEFLVDEPVRLADDRVAWLVQGDRKDEFLPLPKSKWVLRFYTTVNLAERVDHLPDHWEPRKTYDDWRQEFCFTIRSHPPSRFRVTLPPIDANGDEWPIQPIEFEYRPGGFAILPFTAFLNP